MSARVASATTTGRRTARVTGSAVLFGLILSSTGLTPGGFDTAAAAPGGGSCAPNASFAPMIPNVASARLPEADLTAVGQYTTEVEHLESITPGVESQDESDIDAGYTYVGQFIDHDIVLDPRPNTLTGTLDTRTLVNNRTPMLDLDSVYGKGPGASPELYEADGVTLKLGARLTGAASDPEARDHLRDANGRAIIGDPRNDENRITASLHTLVARFHNKLVRDVRAAYPQWSNARVFAEAQNQTRWYYQWAVLTDFLPTMSSSGDVSKVAWYDGSRWNTNLRFYDSCRGSMPTEFSVAAYRWHTMVRDDYVVNDRINDLPIFKNGTDPRNNLGGFSPSPSDFAFDWDFYFSGGARQAQKAYKLDNSLVPSLGQLPGGAAGAGPTNLSVRNLLRGNQLGLPSGQALAKALGIAPLRDDQIIIGPALAPGAPTKAISEFSPVFEGQSPLWSYLFAESVNAKYTVENGRIVAGDSKALRLGPVAATIVNETIVGLLANDRTSVVNNPSFKPDAAYMSNGRFTFRDLIRVASTRTDAPQPVCTTSKQWVWVKTFLFFGYWTLQDKTTCTTTPYPQPKTTRFYSQGEPATTATQVVTPLASPAVAPAPAGPSMMASSNLEAWGWSYRSLTDGVRTSNGTSNGWTSDALKSKDHVEWVIVDRGASTPLSSISLQPRTDGLSAGYGFPVDFTISTSPDGITWTTYVTKTDYAKPGSSAQVFTVPAHSARYIKVRGTELRQNPWDLFHYRMQFAEIWAS